MVNYPPSLVINRHSLIDIERDELKGTLVITPVINSNLDVPLAKCQNAHRIAFLSSFRYLLVAFMAFILSSGSTTAQIQDHEGSTREEKVQALEKQCVSLLRTLNVAQGTYRGGDRTRGFARTLAGLGPKGAQLLDANQVSGEKDGYRFRLVPDKAVRKNELIQHYQIIAYPSPRLTKRQRSYFSDETGIIRFTHENRKATSADPPLPPPYER